MLFAVFLAKFIKWSTIRNYLSGVRSLHVEELGYVPWAYGLRLRRLLKGIKRLLPSSVRKRAPVTIKVLREWFKFFDFKNPLHVEAWLSILLAFYGLLRKSEFTRPDGMLFDPLLHMSWKSFMFEFDGAGRVVSMKYWLARSKTDQDGVGCWVHYAFVGGWLCPVTWLRLLKRMRPDSLDTDPVLLSASGGGMTSSQFSSLVQSLAALSPACAGADITAHSLRIGGCMALFEAGAPDAVIMMLGRWKGASFREYLRSAPAVVLHWNKVMASEQVLDGSGVGAPVGEASSSGVVSSAARRQGAPLGSSPTREQPGLPASSSLIGGFPSPVVVPPAVASPASEIVGQWLGGLCHPLLAPRRGSAAAARSRRAPWSAQAYESGKCEAAEAVESDGLLERLG